MAYCRTCGAPIDDRAVICPKCGVPQTPPTFLTDSGHFGWGLLGFFLPVVGLILFLVWREQKPRTARTIGIGALVSVAVSAALSVITVILYVTILGAGIGMLSSL